MSFVSKHLQKKKHKNPFALILILAVFLGYLTLTIVSYGRLCYT